MNRIGISRICCRRMLISTKVPPMEWRRTLMSRNYHIPEEPEDEKPDVPVDELSPEREEAEDGSLLRSQPPPEADDADLADLEDSDGV